MKNIYRRKDGRYEGRVTIGKNGNKRKYKAFWGKTAEEVAQKMTVFQKGLSQASAIKS